MADELQLVVFKLMYDDAVCEYGVPIQQVQEIVSMENPTKMPQVPDFVEGIINLRGKIIPIIDLKRRFGMGAKKPEEDCKGIWVQVEGRDVGIIVDEVTEVLRLSESLVEPPPMAVGGMTAEYLTGIGKVDDRLLILLDMDKIFSSRDKEALSAVGGMTA